ncbi:hypothetical protein AGOR_G00028280 [Albula goreensis]|uniref:Coiled-coil domain-containing protein 89 n=1 Tax=Albula goreensis TaxID=1534307 RepID=A0A8T3E6D1_9TELE|nr:hypothetical protein AGOR_G00028280 [Albula goreensis]
MVSPQRTPGDMRRMFRDAKQDMDNVHLAFGGLQGLSQGAETEAMLQFGLEEQSSLMPVLKKQADEMSHRCQVLERNNTDLENLRLDLLNQLENERKRSLQLEQRFLDLAANHQELVKFKDEYKRQNTKLTEENKRLHEENESLFCKDLQEKEAIILKLTQELRDLAEEHKRLCEENKSLFFKDLQQKEEIILKMTKELNYLNNQCKGLETEHHKKTTGFQIKLKELLSVHQTKESALQNELHMTRKQLKEALAMCTDLDMQLRETQEKDTSREVQMQDDKLISLQNRKALEDKYEEIKDLESQRQEAENTRTHTKIRSKKESRDVNADFKVKELQQALEESEQTCMELKKDFEAYKKHSSDLLGKEKELNAKLRHMIG